MQEGDYDTDTMLLTNIDIRTRLVYRSTHTVIDFI
jgi:hypothetical protein